MTGEWEMLEAAFTLCPKIPRPTTSLASTIVLRHLLPVRLPVVQFKQALAAVAPGTDQNQNNLKKS